MTASTIRKVLPSEVPELVPLLGDMTRTQRRLIDRRIRGTVPIHAGFFNGEFAAMWGVIPPTLSSNQAYIWVYTTEAIVGHEFLFIRHSQRVVQELLKTYDKIVGITEIGEARSIRWLRLLGAEYGEPEDGHIPFVIRRRTDG